MEGNNNFGFDISSLKVYSGYFLEKEKLSISSSGGAATAISEQIIQKGGVVFGVTYTDDFKKATYACADMLEELEKFKSSKYISTEKKMHIYGEWVPVFSAVEKRLLKNQTVLFIGLGCDVGALLKFLAKKQVNCKNLYTVDLICHGPTYSQVQEDFLNGLEKKYTSKVVAFSVRYKKEGWKPPYIYVEFANGKVYEERLYESEFGYAFKTYSRRQCYECKFKGNNHVADLTLGDYWGCTEGMTGYNSLGVSIIFARTQKGEDMVSHLQTKEDFVVCPADIELALKHNITFYQCREMNKAQYEAFDKSFKKRGLHYAVINSNGYKIYRKRKTKRIIKHMLPDKLIQIVLKMRNG